MPETAQLPCVQIFLSEPLPDISHKERFFFAYAYLLKNWHKYDSQSASFQLGQSNAHFKGPLIDRSLREVVKQVYDNPSLKYGCDIEEWKAAYCGVQTSIKCPLLEQLEVRDGLVRLYNCTIGKLRRNFSDPPTYYMNINGSEIEFTHQQIIKFGDFKSRVAARCKLIPLLPGKGAQQPRWEAIVNTLFEQMEDVAGTPEDASEVWQVKNAICQYLRDSAQGESYEDITTGKPCKNEQQYIFKVDGLQKYLQANRVFVKNPDLWVLIKALGGKTITHRFEDRVVRVWAMPIDKVDE